MRAEGLIDEPPEGASFGLPVRSNPGGLECGLTEHAELRCERDGGYYVAGTRISLDSIVHAFQCGESPEEILRSFPMAGPLVKIYGAITFYLENTEQGRGVPGRARPEALRREWPRSADDPLTKRLREAKEHATQTRS
jgi:uncharacterized protein (DUF433 family)